MKLHAPEKEKACGLSSQDVDVFLILSLFNKEQRRQRRDVQDAGCLIKSSPAIDFLIARS